LATAWSAKDFPAAFYYLTLSQSWVFTLHDNQALLTQLRTMSVTWSISTEWFLYCIYPLLALILRRYGQRVFVVLIISWMSLLSLVYAYHDSVTGFAAATWGPGANANNQFFAWVLKFSPLGRLPEFTTGMITAHFFMTIGDRRRAGLRATYPLVFGIALVVAVYAGLRMDIPQGLKWWLMVTSTFTIPLAFGLIFTSLAGTKTLLSRFLGSRPVSSAGDATYSLYLFHLTAIQSLAIGATVPLSLYWFCVAGARYVVLFALLIPICLGIYKAYEAPLRSAIRRHVDTTSYGAASVVIFLFVGIPALFAAYGWTTGFAK
jgi:peptidoglycan/LPS O-acetylase OafA/YrhL